MRLIAERPVTYTREQIRRLLREYQRLVMGARLPKREEILISKPPRPDEAPFAASSRLKADIDMALRGVSMERVLITFQVLVQCEMRCPLSRTRTHEARNWRQCVGEEWGLTAGEVTEIANETVEKVYERLNRIPVKGYIV